MSTHVVPRYDHAARSRRLYGFVQSTRTFRYGLSAPTNRAPGARKSPCYDRGVQSIVYTDGARNRVVVVPPVRWTQQDAHEAIAEFTRQLGKESRHFIGDCRRMETYESGARIAWQMAFRTLAPQILSFTFVGVKSRIVRMGIATMSLVLTTPMKSVDQLEGLRPIGADGEVPA